MITALSIFLDIFDLMILMMIGVDLPTTVQIIRTPPAKGCIHTI